MSFDYWPTKSASNKTGIIMFGVVSVFMCFALLIGANIWAKDYKANQDAKASSEVTAAPPTKEELALSAGLDKALAAFPDGRVITAESNAVVSADLSTFDSQTAATQIEALRTSIGNSIPSVKQITIIDTSSSIPFGDVTNILGYGKGIGNQIVVPIQ